MRILALLLLLLLRQAPTHAVEPFTVVSPEPLLEEGRWQALHTAKSVIQDIWVDSLGVLLSTGTGLETYDGYRWQVIDGPDSLLVASRKALLRDGTGDIWVATTSGLIGRYDGTGWHVYSQADGLPFGQIGYHGLYEAADGTIWAGFKQFLENRRMSELEGGLRRFDGNAWLPVSPPTDTLDVLSITETKDGALWLGTPKGSWRHKDGSWSFQPLPAGPVRRLRDMLADSDGGMWGAGDDGIWRLVGDSWMQVIRDQLIKNLWQTKDGTLWASTSTGEMCRREQGKPWDCVNTTQLHTPSVGAPVADGSIVIGLSKRLLRYSEEGLWTEFSSPGGLSGGVETADGSIWFVTPRGAVRHQDDEWLVYGVADGFMDATPLAVHGDADGGVWYVGIKDGKSVVSHWKRGMWRVYSVADGLIDDIHQSPKVTVAPELLPHIHDNTFNTPLIRTRSGDTWFVGAHDGLAAACRFDGTGWQRVLVKPEEEGSHLNLAFESADGSLWFGSTNSKAQFSGAGLFRFVEERWTRFSTQDGLAHDLITGISEWPTGVLWVGSADGLNQLQLTSQGVIVGEAQIDFPNAAPKVRYFCPADEVMWYAFLEPRRMGVARVDAHGTRYLTVKDGLPSDGVSQIFRSATGDVWFTAEEGISRYRGGFWSRWTADEHRFPRGSYSPILHEASDSTLWLDLDAPSTGPGAGEDRVVHVRPAADVAPPMTVLEEAASLLASDSAILLNWSATDLWDETATDQMHYQFRLDGGAWSAPDRMHSVRFDTLATGKHVFEARAIDAYGNTDPTPAAHEFVVELPWWLNPWFLLVATVLVSTAAAQTVRVVQGNRRLREEERRVYAAQRQLAAELERELDSARDMQMGLMPTSPPSITGLSVAGGCETANHVGGDLFQYFTSDDRIFIASADVTGHAMEAAIPVVMFSGILDRDMESEHELGERFQGLNRSLCRSLGDHKFICFTMAEIEDKSLRLASCGNPYPLHFHDGEVSELKVDGYPLGVRPDTQYDTIETQLHEGDYLVLYSDGIPETINPSEEMFGYERTIETVREACSEGICAEDLVERLIRKAREFAGDEHQADDMTCVVVKVEAEDGRE